LFIGLPWLVFHYHSLEDRGHTPVVSDEKLLDGCTTPPAASMIACRPLTDATAKPKLA
jgi:hypothetical protein